MKEMPSLNMPVQRLKVAVLPLDLPCCGPVTHSGEILTTGKSHRKSYYQKRYQNLDLHLIRCFSVCRLQTTNHVRNVVLNENKRQTCISLIGKSDLHFISHWVRGPETNNSVSSFFPHFLLAVIGTLYKKDNSRLFTYFQICLSQSLSSPTLYNVSSEKAL